jgi:hypothetical protein
MMAARSAAGMSGAIDALASASGAPTIDLHRAALSGKMLQKGRRHAITYNYVCQKQIS